MPTAQILAISFWTSACKCGGGQQMWYCYFNKEGVSEQAIHLWGNKDNRHQLALGEAQINQEYS